MADNRAFAEKFSFPFRLLSDPDRRIGLAYEACKSAGAGYPARHTYVISPDGIVEQAIDTRDPAGQAAALLELIG